MIMLLFTSSFGHTQTVTLSCAGKLTLYPEQVLDVEVNGVVIYVLKESVKIVNLKGVFADNDGTNYQVTQTIDSRISFKNPVNSRVSGTLNRYSGQVFLAEKDSVQDDLLIRVFRGVCKQQGKLF